MGSCNKRTYICRQIVQTVWDKLNLKSFIHIICHQNIVWTRTFHQMIVFIWSEMILFIFYMIRVVTLGALNKLVCQNMGATNNSLILVHPTFSLSYWSIKGTLNVQFCHTLGRMNHCNGLAIVSLEETKTVRLLYRDASALSLVFRKKDLYLIITQKLTFHEIRRISYGFRTDFRWNPPDFVRISGVKSARFRKTNCQEW